MLDSRIGVNPLFIDEYTDFATENAEALVQRLIEHVFITAETVAIAVPLAVALGIAITYNDTAATIVLWLAGIAMTLPSLALFGLLVPFLGIGSPPVVFTLVLYSQLPVIRNTYIGLTGVDESIIEAGEGLGMSRWERLRRIQLPMALPVIVAGIRNAVVIVVGVAAVGSYIGAGGLGTIIFEGIREADTAAIVVATIVITALALVIDYGIATLEELLRLRNGESIEANRGVRLLRRAVA